MVFDRFLLGYTLRGKRVFVHYPLRADDGSITYAGGFPVEFPEFYFHSPPNEITRERVAIMLALLAAGDT